MIPIEFNKNRAISALKKTEKISQAVYLITNLFKDSEPLKWRLREKCIDAIDNSYFSGIDVHNHLFEIKSLLIISKTAGLISDMNFEILVSEIDKFSESLKDAGYVLSESFFKEDRNLPLNQGFFKKVDTANDSDDKSSKKDISPRKNRIIDLFKTGATLTIKDISKVIVDCSEKTIQRELLEMVNQGVLKKEGERRWSKYTLINPR